MTDRDLAIAFGRNRTDANWKNEYLSWDEFINEISVVRRTKETMAEYSKMSKAQQGRVKDGPSFVGGFVQHGRRKKENVQSRSLITLDVDHADDDFLFMVDLILGGTAHLIYSTHSHRPKKPKYRLVTPTDRDLSPDEYAAVSRKLADQIGINYFDRTTFQVHRLMYYPSCSHDAEPIFDVYEGGLLDCDAILAEYDDWQDPLEWPKHPDEDAIRKSDSKMEDPHLKQGVLGTFCRQYTISEAIDKFLPGVYEPTKFEDRYTYKDSTSYGGLVVYDGDLFAYSHHESDPISGREVNAFDLVRIHKFGDLDEKSKEGTVVTKLPSYAAMLELAANDEAVKKETLAAIHEEFDVIQDDEDDDYDYDWVKDLDVHSKTGQPLSTAKNCELILRNGPFRNVLAYDAFGNTEVVKGKLPWRDRERQHLDYEPWLGADDKRLQHYFGKVYEIKSSTMIQNAFTEVVHSNSFHPIKEYIEAQKWDGVSRVDRLFITYLGADDTHYIRSVTRKMLVAAITRLYEPGCKFDEMLVLVGPQGAGKSSLLAKLGRKWFSDSLRTFENKEAGEHLQGAWIFEIGELAAMRKAEVEEIKTFLSKTEDRYRVAYDRQVSEFPRKCVFFGTTNNYNFLHDPTGNRRFWPVDVNPAEREKSHWDHLTDEVVGQIWAEALHLYRQGEDLKLDKEAAAEALRMQGIHTEEDPREGLIEKYLNTPLPTNWDELDIWSRRMYLEEEPTGSIPGSIQRTRVCAAEVWAEALGNDPAKFGVWESRPINDILRKFPQWEERRGRVRFKHYGTQTAFVRKNGTN